MRTIYKYPAKVGEFELSLPVGATIVMVADQRGHQDNTQLTIWAEVHTEAVERTHRFLVVGTGHEIPEGFEHVGSWQAFPFVWHLYEFVN